MQEIMPYYNETPPRYRANNKYRKIYFVRIAVFIIILCFSAAAVIWFFSLSPKTITFNPCILYFTGEASLTEFTSQENKNGLIIDCAAGNFSVLDAELFNASFFCAEELFFSKIEAESNVLQSAENGLRRAVLKIDMSGILVKAHNDEALDKKVLFYFDEGLYLLQDLQNISKKIADKTISQELYERRIINILEKSKTVLKDVLTSKTDCATAFTAYFSALCENIDILSQMALNNAKSYINKIILKTAYNYYTLKPLINGLN